MRVRYVQLEEGPGPSEMLVGVKTFGGNQEEVVISKRQTSGEAFEVGSPLISEENRILIELPRESLAGRWRIWIPQSEVIDPVHIEAAE